MHRAGLGTTACQRRAVEAAIREDAAKWGGTTGATPLVPNRARAVFRAHRLFSGWASRSRTGEPVMSLATLTPAFRCPRLAPRRALLRPRSPKIKR
jgi:hypothetical protein